MNRDSALRWGGLAAGVVLILFGIGALYLGIDARQTVSDELSREKIVGSPDMSPDEIEQAVQEAGLEDVEIPSCDVADEEITTGSEARCFAQYMRIHALESSGWAHVRGDGAFRLRVRSERPGRDERRGGRRERRGG